MKKFEEPMIKIIEFKTADVITTSLAEPILDHDNARKNAYDIAKFEDFFKI